MKRAALARIAAAVPNLLVRGQAQNVRHGVASPDASRRYAPVQHQQTSPDLRRAGRARSTSSTSSAGQNWVELRGEDRRVCNVVRPHQADARVHRVDVAVRAVFVASSGRLDVHGALSPSKSVDTLRHVRARQPRGVPGFPSHAEPWSRSRRRGWRVHGLSPTDES
jgi:hypothetical protein